MIGRQAGNQVMSYQTEAGDVLEILYMGEQTAEVCTYSNLGVLKLFKCYFYL